MLLEAEQELTAAAIWYDERIPKLGEEFTEEVLEACFRILDYPSLSPRLRIRHREFRKYLLRRFPYFIIYEVLPGEIVVTAISHANRRPNYWRKRI